MNTKALLSLVAGLGLVGVALGGTAQADTNVGSATALAAVGSDTSQDVVEGLAGLVGGGATIANYKATGSATITTRTGVAACTGITRPVGSGNGLNALSAAVGGLAGFGSTNLQGCIDFARSSSGSNPTVAPGGGTGRLTYVPFAVDSVTYATLGTTNVPKNLNKSDLFDIYGRNTGNCSFAPLLPQAGSGTRNFFLGSLGFTSNNIGAAGGPGTCVKDVNAASAPIIEHDGRFLVNGDNIIPFSTGQYIAQASGIIPDIRGRATLGSVDFTNAGVQGTSPFLLNTTFGFNRPLYNVIPTDALTLTTTTPFNYPLIKSTFVGPTASLCTASANALINQYGFADIPTGYAGSGPCGDTAKKNTN